MSAWAMAYGFFSSKTLRRRSANQAFWCSEEARVDSSCFSAPGMAAPRERCNERLDFRCRFRRQSARGIFANQQRRDFSRGDEIPMARVVPAVDVVIRREIEHHAVDSLPHRLPEPAIGV